MADRVYDEAQEAVAALRPRADELIEDVMAELCFNLRKPVLSLSKERTRPASGGLCAPTARASATWRANRWIWMTSLPKRKKAAA